MNSELNQGDVTVPAFTLETTFSEWEFLSRELNLEIQSVSVDQLLGRVRENFAMGQRTVIVGSGAGLANLMDVLPRASIIMVQVSDENFAPHRFFLYGHPAVHVIIRNYGVEPAPPWMLVRAAFGYARDNLARPKKIRILFSTFRELYKHRSRAREIRKLAGNSLITFPLGYTNKFCAEYSTRFKLLGRQSLIQHRISVQRASAGSHRKILMSFIGAPGRIQREALFHVFRNSSKHVMLVPVIRDSWLGHDGAAPSASDYVETFLNSWFVACPPGTIANESFRTVEAQVCGAEPIGLTVCLTQGTIDPVHSGFVRVYSWSHAKHVIFKIGEEGGAANAYSLRETHRILVKTSLTIRSALRVGGID